MGSTSIIFGHMINARQLFGWAQFAEKYLTHKGPKVVLLLRYQRSIYEGELCARAFRMLERASARGPLTLSSDSARLARELETLTELPVSELPIPHTSSIQAGEVAERHGDGRRPLRFVSLGNARDEKGIFEILEAITIVRRSDSGDQYEFVLQVNDARPDVQQAIDGFVKLRQPGVLLIDQAMDTEAYYKLLNSADVVMLPYWRSIYQSRTSGIFTEAVAAGKPVICTTDTWMSDELAEVGAGITCREKDASDLARAIGLTHSNFAGLKDTALAARSHFIAKHNAIALVETIAGGRKRREVPGRRPRVALFFPWADLATGGSGASARVGLLLDFLEENGAEVRVLAAGDANVQRSAHVHIASYQIVHPADSDYVRAYLGKISQFVSFPPEGSYHLWFEWAARQDRSLHSRIAQIVSWADVALVDYPYFAEPVRKACIDHGVRHIVTAHDILSDKVQSRFLRWLTRRMELRALAQADEVVAVTALDQRRLLDSNIKATLIPNPIDTANLPRLGHQELRSILELLHGISQSAPICLFVGSGYEANRIAAAKVGEIARAVKSRAQGSSSLFVTAGKCAEPGEISGVLALGRIDDFSLRCLYAAARMVVIPLQSGTGMSVKTIESLAAGKATVGTSIAFRGIDIESGRECIVEDDLERFADTVMRLLDDDNEVADLGKRAKFFAGKYDYRLVFKEYLPLLRFSTESRLQRREEDNSPNADIPLEMARLLLHKISQTETRTGHARLLEVIGRTHIANRQITTHVEKLLSGSPELAREVLTDYEDAKPPGYDSATWGRVIAKARSDPQLVEVREMAWKLFHDRNLEMVRSFCKAILAAVPEHKHADIHYLLALSSHDLRKLPDALNHYGHALACGGDEFWLRFHRGRLWIELGDQDQAKIDFARALAIKPGDADATRLLASL